MTNLSLLNRPFLTKWITGFALTVITASPTVHAALLVDYDWTSTYNATVSPNTVGSIVYDGTGGGNGGEFVGSANTGNWSVSNSVSGWTLNSNGGDGDSVNSARTMNLLKKDTVWPGWSSGDVVFEIAALVHSQVTGSNYAQGFRLIRDNQAYFFYLGDGFIGFGDDLTGANMATYSMTTTDDFHTYQLVLGTSNASVYVDGGASIVLTAAVRSTLLSNRIEFGDPTDTNGGGSVTYSSINWTVIPEPSTALLFILGGITLGYRRRGTR